MLVPHAFSPKENDPDCPPHFYANGTNPQFPLFKDLMMYMQRGCHALSSGVHKANAAIFYNAEGEWCGGANCLFQEVATNLAESQIDYNFVPSDVLLSSSASVKNGCLVVGQMSYDALVISYSEVFPEVLLKVFNRFAAEGLPVIFTDNLPDRCETENNIESICRMFTVVPTTQIASYFIESGFTDIVFDCKYPDVRVLHLVDDLCDRYFLMNYSTECELDTYVHVSDRRENYVEYDIWNNKLLKMKCENNGLHVILPPGNSVMIIATDDDVTYLPEKEYIKCNRILPDVNFDVSVSQNDEFIHLSHMNSTDGLRNLAVELPHFSGTVRYEGYCTLYEQVLWIDLGTVGETATLWINDICCGNKIHTPYVFDVSSVWNKGENHIVIEIINNPGYKKRDMFSQYLHLPPTGLLGPIEYFLQ